MYDQNPRMQVQYGCGWDAPESWVNFDASPTLRLERLPLAKRFVKNNPLPFPANVRYGDIVTGLPIEEGSCHLLYCSHVLEHLALEDLDAAVRNSFEVLAPGGIWRLVLPDLRSLAENYLSDPSPNAAEKFMMSTGLGLQTRPRALKSRISNAYGNSGHLWMWDFESLSARLAAAGFVAIRAAGYRDSEFIEFEDVENLERWEGSLGIECRKPGSTPPT